VHYHSEFHFLHLRFIDFTSPTPEHPTPGTQHPQEIHVPSMNRLLGKRKSGSQLPGDAVGDPMAVPPFHWIDRQSVEDDGKMEVIAACESGFPCLSDGVAARDLLTRSHADV